MTVCAQRPCVENLEAIYSLFFFIFSLFSKSNMILKKQELVKPEIFGFPVVQVVVCHLPKKFEEFAVARNFG